MNAFFGLEQAVSIAAAGGESDTLDSRLFSCLYVNDLVLEVASLSPTQVHSQEHFRPVLGFGTTGTGVYADDGIARVIATAQHSLKFLGRDLCVDVFGKSQLVLVDLPLRGPSPEELPHLLVHRSTARISPQSRRELPAL